MTVVIRGALAVASGVLVLLPLVACTTAPPAPGATATASRAGTPAPRQAGLAGTRRHSVSTAVLRRWLVPGTTELRSETRTDR